MNTPVCRLLLALLALCSIPPAVFGHGYLKTPRSRNYAAYEDNRGEYQPWSANRKAVSETCGTTPPNPDIKNYDFLLHTGVQATYSSGQVVDFDVDMTAHHKGHFVLKACVVPPGQRATQACFDRNPLRFISGHGANPHPNYPDRAYLPPANPPAASNGAHPLFPAPTGRWSYRYKFQLPPGLSGDLVLLQWHYIASNSCLPPGYNTYNWPAGWNPGNLPVCVDIPLYGSDSNGFVQAGRPEQFWNCAEVRILTGGGGPAPTPTPPPVGGSGSLTDWTFCSSSSQCRNGCCSRLYSNDGRLKCTPVGGFQASHCVTGGVTGGNSGSLGDWNFCTTNSQCRNGCCSNRYSNDGRMKCTPGGC